jgi:hypothetical protein
MSFQYISRADRPVARWRLYAPPPVSWSLAAAYGLMLVPAILGTVWAWPLGVTAALLIPGLSLHIVLGSRTAQARGIRSMPPMRMRLMMMPAYFVVILLTMSVRPLYAAPLFLAMFTMLVVDPIDRALRRRYPY